jgi:ketosteroid isomerase-like protein
MTRRLLTPVLLAAALLGTPRPTTAQPHTPNTQAVQAAVEHFLDVLGKRELDKLPALMAPKATMAVLRQREGQWTTTIQTFDEWLAALRAQTASQPFREPLSNVSVHVEDGRLAFLRADFTVVIGGEVRAHGIDYFTLVRDGEACKILNGSYTNHAGPPKTTK